MAVQNKTINRKYNTVNFQRADDTPEFNRVQSIGTMIGALLFFLIGGLVLLMVGFNSFDPFMLIISIVLVVALVYIILSAFNDGSSN